MPILGLPAAPPVDGVTYPPGWTFGHTLVDLGPTRWGRCDADGVEWHVANLTGWDDTPDVVAVANQNIGRHGATTGPQVYGPRKLTLDGWIVARTLTERNAALRQLHRSAPVNALTVVAVTDPTDPPTRYVQARIDGPIKAARMGENCHAIQVPLLADDPRKYGLNPDPTIVTLPSFGGGLTLPQTPPWTLPVRISGGSGPATNHGDMPAPWTAVITGPITTPTITNITTDRRLGINVALGDGDTLTIDSRTQTVILNGTASRAGLITRGSTWFELPEDTTSEVGLTSSILPTGGTPNVVFTALSAWA